MEDKDIELFCWAIEKVENFKKQLKIRSRLPRMKPGSNSAQNGKGSQNVVVGNVCWHDIIKKIKNEIDITREIWENKAS